jgi:uncharacterized membrane protein YtjA (UPF0391 family)
MSWYAAIFFLIAIVGAIVGFHEIAAPAGEIAKMCSMPMCW